MKAFLVAVQVLYIFRQIFAELEGSPDLEIPREFFIGAATSAYQIEGAWNVSDKSESIWDRRAHTNALFYGSGDHGDVAADSYHKYKEDVQIIKNIGLKYYRFSISWARILPTGSWDRISKDGIQYYKNLIDELRANGIEPLVTMHHFDDVQALIEKTGGWTNESMIEYFDDYARVLFKELGPKVKFWTTFNELNAHCIVMAQQNELIPNIAYSDRYRCAHNMLKAHAAAYYIYNLEFEPDQKGQIGLVVAAMNDISLFPADLRSQNIAFDFDIGWIVHPVFSKEGDYPKVMKQRIAENSEVEGLPHSRLPKFSPEEIKTIRGAAHFLGITHYMSFMVASVPKINGRWYDDSGIKKSYHPDWHLTTTNFTINPKGIGQVLRHIKDAYGNPQVHILENGMADKPELKDINRISYLYSFMKEVLLALHDGCYVKSYIVWSLLDNFEWFWGNAAAFGLVHVDFNHPNRTRTRKLSSYWLEKVIKGRKLIPYTSFQADKYFSLF